MADPNPDFRALCERLLDEVIYLSELPYEQEPDAELMAATRAALAEPAPEPTFTDEEVEMHLAPWSYLDPAPEVPTNNELDELWMSGDWYKDATLREFRSIARAVLARWGQGDA